MRSNLAVAATATCVWLITLAAPAFAAFGGENGKIAYSANPAGELYSQVHTVNPDGTDLRQITMDPLGGTSPAWSPNGQHILFGRGFEVWRMDADGSDEMYLNTAEYGPGPVWSPDGTQIAHAGITIGPSDDTCCHSRITNREYDGIDVEPAWSPDGTTIAFSRHRDAYDLYIVRPDGTGLTNLTADPSFQAAQMPNWSPDGQLIAWGSEFGGGVHIMQADGTGATMVPGTELDREPAFSPDGSRIAAETWIPQPAGHSQLVTYNLDGSDRFLIPGTEGATDPDWQPLLRPELSSYVRPKSANLVQIKLVPAYAQCTAPNRTHGPALASDSCDPPTQVSDEVTLGTADANGRPTKGGGVVRYAAVAGFPSTVADEADVQIVSEFRDVYDQSTLADYTGELRLRTAVQITDKFNVPAPGAATVSAMSLGSTVPCASTSDPNAGASCFLTTTVDALVPGTVPELKRSVWELGQVQVDDGGADGDAETAGDNTLFMVQGVFVP